MTGAGKPGPADGLLLFGPLGPLGFRKPPGK